MSNNKLRHTLEEIDYKLDLIDKNKNLLPYPYTYPDGSSDYLEKNVCEDVGDGSFLITPASIPANGKSIYLTDVTLTPGKK